MLEDSIKIGDRIEIYPKKRQSSNIFYVSRVEEIRDNNILVAQVPASLGKLVRLPLDRAYSFQFFSGNGMLRLDARIKEYFVEDRLHMMLVQMETAAEKFQRREFFRFDCGIKIKVGVVAKDYDIARDSPSPAMSEGITLDISAGGLRFTSSVVMDVGARLKLILPLGDDSLMTLSRILHRQDVSAADYRYQYRVMFLDLTSTEKEKIVKYIFMEQRRALRTRQ